MSDDDLIRRGDALKALDWGDIYGRNAQDAISALPASMTPEVRELVEAAEPLAAMASRYDPEDGDGDLECWSGLAVPKIKHIRALRAALAALRERCDA